MASERELKPVYLLTGSDRPKIETALARLRGRFPGEAAEIVSAADTPGHAAVALCNAGSLFGDARLVVVEHVDGRRDSDGRLKGGWKAADVSTVAAYLASPAPATVLCLVGEEVKKSTPLAKACAKAGEILEYAVAKNKLQGWVAEQFRQRDVQAEPEAITMLIQLVGDDLHALALEVDKLAVWADGEPIGEREVEALASPRRRRADVRADRRLGRAQHGACARGERDDLRAKRKAPPRHGEPPRGDARQPLREAPLDQAARGGGRTRARRRGQAPHASVLRREGLRPGRGLLERRATRRRRPPRRSSTAR